MSFPEGFRFGMATSAYQIEGAVPPTAVARRSGTPSAPDPEPSTTAARGTVACDHYRRWESDVDLMRRLGLAELSVLHRLAARFPEGRGR